jgi:SagB-type dehydrogenase family enzyme
MSEAIKQVRAYHELTKHRLSGYAPAPGFLDWDSQPNPFRTYDGALKIDLPFGLQTQDFSSDWSLANIGAFLELSMGLSAWKSIGPDRWALRTNPSSGNLHPTECYVLNWSDDEGALSQGVYHYDVYGHRLEQRGSYIAPLVTSAFGAIGLSTISWREEWKYGERAYRYCQLDVGHAIGAIRYACALFGWKVTPVFDFCDDDLDQILGTGRTEDYELVEREEPDLLLVLSKEDVEAQVPDLVALQQVNWQGKANPLSAERVAWPAIKRVKKAVIKETGPIKKLVDPASSLKWHGTKDHLVQVIQKRRSAQRMDKEKSVLDRDDFFNILQRTRPCEMPFDTLNHQPTISLFLFVHHVDGLEPGLYFFERSLGHLKALQQKGTAVPGCDGLYKISVPHDVRKISSQLSCNQGIAGHGAFAVSMLADFTCLETWGSWAYRLIHWEAGLIGQCLYLEAENIGLNGTGIGCFFDDEVHNVLGLVQTDGDWQVVYHFTLGVAKTDNRLESEPPFAHLSER